MVRYCVGRLSWIGLAALAIVALGAQRMAVAQQSESAAKATVAKAATGEKPSPGAAEKTKPEKAKDKKAAKPRGRLPAFYTDVVDQKQREAIYAIQEQCEPKIAELRAQLEKLTKERDTRIEALLTPEQRKKIEDLKAANKAKRQPKKPAEKK